MHRLGINCFVLPSLAVYYSTVSSCVLDCPAFLCLVAVEVLLSSFTWELSLPAILGNFGGVTTYIFFMSLGPRVYCMSNVRVSYANIIYSILCCKADMCCLLAVLRFRVVDCPHFDLHS